MRRAKKKSHTKPKKRHPLSSQYDYAREMLREELFDAHNKFLEKVAYNFGGEIVNTTSNKDITVGMTIEEFDSKGRGDKFGDTIDKLDFILTYFSNRNKMTLSNCKKLLKLYKKYKWPIERNELEYTDSSKSDLIYLPIFVITWPDGIDENYTYMEELCQLVARCVDFQYN